MLQIREIFLLEGVAHPEINVHVHLVIYEINIYTVSFLRDLEFFMFPPPVVTNEQKDQS